MAINIGKNADGDVTYQNPPVNRVLFPNITDYATPEAIEAFVNAWLDDHPEATTTVEDGSILPVKLDSTNSATDGYVLSYNATAGKFEWYDVGGELDDINSDITDLKQDMSEVQEEVGDVSMYTLGLYPQKSVADVAVASFTDGADDIPVKSLTVDITPVQSGSGDPSPSNVRPISGWTGATVNVKGFNQFDGEWVTDSGYHTAKNYMSVIPGKTYYVYAPHVPSGQAVYVNEYGADKTLISSSVNIGRIGAYTIPSGVYYMKLRVWGEFDCSELCFNISDQSKNGTYEPYKGHVYDIDLQTEAGTVYGGTLDVTRGVLTIDRAYVTITAFQGKSSATTNNAFYATTYASTIKKPSANSETLDGLLSDKFLTRQYDGLVPNDVTGIAVNISGYIYVGFGLDGISTYEQANTWASSNPIQVVYPLDTPQTVQLSPTDVVSLINDSNLWASTGNVTLTYRADLKAYIDEKLA